MRYGVQDSGSTQVLSVTATQVIISELEPFTVYAIEVAAMNSVGLGVYSSPITVRTLGEMCVLSSEPSKHVHISSHIRPVHTLYILS